MTQLSDENIKTVRNTLKVKLKNLNDLCGFQNERAQISDLIQRTITTGESNSGLVIGPSGVGKTTVSF